MQLHIKNMVCNRCIMVVKSELEKFGLHPLYVVLGEATITEELDQDQLGRLNDVFVPIGFSLIDDKKMRLIEKVKNLITDLVQHQDGKISRNLSDLISEELNGDYNYISTLFTQYSGSSIEQYFIHQRIEKVKELLVYDELTLSEISYQLNYSSVSHLSKQFKKVTGHTPSFYKQFKSTQRKSLEEL